MLKADNPMVDGKIYFDDFAEVMNNQILFEWSFSVYSLSFYILLFFAQFYWIKSNRLKQIDNIDS